MAAQRVDQLCTLPEMALISPECDRSGRVLRTLCHHEGHVRAQCRLSNHCSLRGIILLASDKRPAAIGRAYREAPLGRIERQDMSLSYGSLLNSCSVP